MMIELEVLLIFMVIAAVVALIAGAMNVIGMLQRLQSV